MQAWVNHVTLVIRVWFCKLLPPVVDGALHEHPPLLEVIKIFLVLKVLVVISVFRFTVWTSGDVVELLWMWLWSWKALRGVSQESDPGPACQLWSGPPLTSTWSDIRAWTKVCSSTLTQKILLMTSSGKLSGEIFTPSTPPLWLLGYCQDLKWDFQWP